MRIEIRRAEPADCKAVQQVHSQPRAIWGTLQVPFPSEEVWKKRLTDAADEMYALVACVEGEVVAMAGLHVYPNRRAAVTSATSAWQCTTSGTRAASARR